MESDSLDPRVVNHLLDKAVATAARELLPCDSVLDESVAKRVVDQLEKMRSRKANFHDPLTPVLYSTWYQLGHVNLAIRIAQRMVQRWKELSLKEDEIRIVDIGSGTLVLPIAFDILRITGNLDINVRMLSIESSREMEYCGRRIRALLGSEVSWLRSLGDTTASFGIHLGVREDSPFFSHPCTQCIRVLIRRLKYAYRSCDQSTGSRRSTRRNVLPCRIWSVSASMLTTPKKSM